MNAEGRPGKSAPQPTTIDAISVPRQTVRNTSLTVVAKTYIVHGCNGRVWLLLVVRCACGSIHQHRTSNLNFGEGVRKAGCGRRYLVRASVTAGIAA